MRVIAHVLEGIDDERLMIEQMGESEAISDIVRAYNRLALTSMEQDDPDHHLHIVSQTTSGYDFKQWVACLPAPERWRLLDRYVHLLPLAPVPDEPPPERRKRSRRNEDDTDKHTLRHFTIRLALVVVFMLVILVLAAGVSFMQNNHMLPDNVVFKTILETSAELAKILFTFK